MSDTTKISLDLIGQRLIELQAAQRGIHTENGLLRAQIQGLEGRMIDAVNDRIGRFEVRVETLLAELQAAVALIALKLEG